LIFFIEGRKKNAQQKTNSSIAYEKSNRQ